jgi:triacylglycerol lipase
MKSIIAFGLVAGVSVAVLSGLRAADLETIRDVTYVQRGSQDLKADVYVPNGPGPFPAVLVVHGGGWRSGSKDRFGRFADRLAGEGFTAVAINYRLAPDDKFPAQIDDCKNAVRWMRKNAAKYKIDPDRIGALGYSAGGHLVALLGVTDPSCGLEGPDADGTSTRLQCVVAGGAPCDFRLIPPNVDRLAYWLGGTRAEKQAAYEQASPLNFASKDDPPILFFHGEDDRLVPILGAQTMVAKLTSLGVTARLVTIPGAGHPQAVGDERAWTESVKFLQEHLQNTAAKKNAS